MDATTDPKETEMDVTLTLSETQARAVRAAIDALVERDRELPAGDPHGDPTWRIDRMANALVAQMALDEALRALPEPERPQTCLTCGEVYDANQTTIVEHAMTRSHGAAVKAAKAWTK
jgi:hypothetical protein